MTPRLLTSTGRTEPSARILGHLEQQPLYNSINWSLECDQDAYGTVANSTVTVTRLKPHSSALRTRPPLTWERGPRRSTPWSPPATITSPRWAPRSNGARIPARSRGRRRPRTAPPQRPVQFRRLGHRSPRHSRRLEQYRRLRRVDAWAARLRREAAQHPGRHPHGHHHGRQLPGGREPEHADGLDAERGAGQRPPRPGLQLCASNASNPSMRSPPTSPRPWARRGGWACPATAWATCSCRRTPKTPNCNVASSNAVNQPGVYGLSSYHSGGANVLFADGSVKFLKDSTTSPVIWALGSRAQGRGSSRRTAIVRQADGPNRRESPMIPSLANRRRPLARPPGRADRGQGRGAGEVRRRGRRVLREEGPSGPGRQLLQLPLGPHQRQGRSARR